MRVALLHVAQALNEHFDGDVFIVCEQMPLRAVSGKVDERIGVRSDTSETSEDVAQESVLWRKTLLDRLLVQEEDLLSASTPCFSADTAHAFTTWCEREIEEFPCHFLARRQLLFSHMASYIIRYTMLAEGLAHLLRGHGDTLLRHHGEDCSSVRDGLHGIFH